MERGLDEKQVAQSREKHGSNEIRAKKKKGFFRLFIEGFSDPIIKILLIALVVNVLINIRSASFFESGGIAAAVIAATFVSALSEYGSEKAFERMSGEAAKRICRVVRSGRLCEIPESDIVVGDVILLGAGERIPADGRMTEGRLSVDQSPLNGESREKQKFPDKDSADGDLSSSGKVFRGSVVTGGEGVMVAEKVGESSFWGGMALGMREAGTDSPLRERLTRLASVLSRFGYIAAAALAS